MPMDAQTNTRSCDTPTILLFKLVLEALEDLRGDDRVEESDCSAMSGRVRPT